MVVVSLEFSIYRVGSGRVISVAASSDFRYVLRVPLEDNIRGDSNPKSRGKFMDVHYQITTLSEGWGLHRYVVHGTELFWPGWFLIFQYLIMRLFLI